MNTLKMFNPANGKHIVDVPADDAASVATKAAQARAAQPRWAATPLAERKACMVRFRALLAERIDNARQFEFHEYKASISNKLSTMPGVGTSKDADMELFL